MNPGEGMIVQTVKDKPYRTPGQKRQLWIALVFLGLVGIGLFAAYKLLIGQKPSYTLRNFTSAVATVVNLDNSAQAAGSVEVLVQMKILSSANGFAGRLLVENGDRVAEGQILASLTMPDLEKTLRKAQDSLTESLLTLEKYQIQTESAIAKSERSVAKSLLTIEEAKAELANTLKLAALGSASPSEVKQKEDSLATLEYNLWEAQAALDESKQVYAIDLKLKRKAISDIEETIQEYEEQLVQALVTSPIAGDVLSINNNLMVPGSRIASAAELFTIGEPSSAQAIVEVEEQYATLINVGDRAQLLVAGVWTEGTVTSVGKVAVLSSDGVTSTIEIKIKPDTIDLSFMQGAGVTALFPLGTREGVLTLPRGAYLTTGNQKFLYVVEGAKAYRRTVSFGEIKEAMVEVLSGLAAGETVITSGYQNFIEFDEVLIATPGGSK